MSAGRHVLVVTVTAGTPDPEALSPAARRLHAQWGLADGDVVALRREEDRAACAELGADVIHWDELDAIYRRDPATGQPFYPTVGAVFGPPAAGDRGRVAAWAQRLRDLPAARVVGPFGIGRHVDHVLLRQAAGQVFGPRLELYEDYPYARSWWTRRKGLWRGGWPPWRGPAGWRSRPLRPEGPALAAKLRALERYSSQLGSVFAGSADLRRQVGRFTERLWFRF